MQQQEQQKQGEEIEQIRNQADNPEKIDAIKEGEPKLFQTFSEMYNVKTDAAKLPPNPGFFDILAYVQFVFTLSDIQKMFTHDENLLQRRLPCFCYHFPPILCAIILCLMVFCKIHKLKLFAGHPFAFGIDSRITYSAILAIIASQLVIIVYIYTSLNEQNDTPKPSTTAPSDSKEKKD